MAGPVPPIRARWLLEPGAGLAGLSVVGGWGAGDSGGVPSAAAEAAALGLLLLLAVGAASFVLGRRHRPRAAPGPDAELRAGDVVDVALLLVAFGVASWADGPLGWGRLAWPLFGAVSVAAYARCLYRAGGQGASPPGRRARVARRRRATGR